MKPRTMLRSALALALVSLAAGASPAGGEIKWKSDDEVKATLEKAGSLEVKEMPLEELLPLLRRGAGVNVVLDAGVSPETKATITVKDVAWKEILSATLASASPDLGWEVWHRSIVIAPKKRPAKPPELQLSEAAKKAFEAPAMLYFRDPLSDVADFLSDLTGQTLRPAAGLETRPISLRVRGIPLADAIALLCRANGLALVREGDAHVFQAE